MMKVTFISGESVSPSADGDILLARPKRMEKRSAQKEGVARSGGIFLLIAEFDLFYLFFLPLSYRQILGDTNWSVIAT